MEHVPECVASSPERLLEKFRKRFQLKLFGSGHDHSGAMKGRHDAAAGLHRL